jgi:hypothetical protein
LFRRCFVQDGEPNNRNTNNTAIRQMNFHHLILELHILRQCGCWTKRFSELMFLLIHGRIPYCLIDFTGNQIGTLITLTNADLFFSVSENQLPKNRFLLITDKVW